MAISSRLATTAYCCMISTITIIALILVICPCECSNVHSCIQIGYVCLKIVTGWTTTSLNRSLSIVLAEVCSSNIKVCILATCNMLIVCNCSIQRDIVIQLLMRIARSSISSLFSQLGLSNGLGYRRITRVITTVISGVIDVSYHVLVVLCRIKELRCHHHLLLGVLASIWRFSLVR